MILVFGGTTEGRKAVKVLEEGEQPFFYSTKGDEQEIALKHGVRLSGAMDTDSMTDFCIKHHIRLLVDAAHPFAGLLHQTIAQVSRTTGIQVIRFERLYPERDRSICWCHDYEDATRRISTEGIGTLLILTGVQSIAPLAGLRRQVCCHFRILDRDSSRHIARQENLPDAYIHYYHAESDEHTLMRQVAPDAILLKESGYSGGFCEKVQAAADLGIRIYALRRPDMPAGFLTVDGEWGLRREVERLLPDFYRLHSGLTTGTCATAASVAAVMAACTMADDKPIQVPVLLPDGETIAVAVDEISPVVTGNAGLEKRMWSAVATVIKDAGDDPDITNGMRICVTATLSFHQSDHPTIGTEEFPIYIEGGKGVGRVTLPGLGLPVGSAAINATPRRMMETNVRHLLRRTSLSSSISSCSLTVSIPQGEELAVRTFNPRLGIEGGLSVIGTSGIVKPFSSEAFVQSIRRSMEVAQATKSPLIVINSGARSEAFLHKCYPKLPLQAFVHYGNFIGETLKMAAELDVGQVALGVMIGKAVKLAEGHMDTHSRHVTMNKEFIMQMVRESGCSLSTVKAAGNITLARELWDIIPSDELLPFCHCLMAHCLQHCGRLFPTERLCILLITEEGDIIR